MAVLPGQRRAPGRGRASAKMSTYRLDSFGPVGDPADPTGGIFQLSNEAWHLTFGPSEGGVSCGLLRSRVEVGATTRRRRTRVTVTDDADPGFTATFVVKARADTLRADVRRRYEALDRAADTIAAVEAGQWWRGEDAFRSLGWSGTRSIAGVRFVGGSWEVDGLRPNRRARVLDFGPDGVSWRGWRTRMRLPWESIADIEVASGNGHPEPHHPPADQIFHLWLGDPASTEIVVRNHSDERITFRTELATPAQVRDQLGDPVARLLRPPSEEDGLAPGPASGRSAVDALPSTARIQGNRAQADPRAGDRAGEGPTDETRAGTTPPESSSADSDVQPAAAPIDVPSSPPAKPSEPTSAASMPIDPVVTPGGPPV